MTVVHKNVEVWWVHRGTHLRKELVTLKLIHREGTGVTQAGGEGLSKKKREHLPRRDQLRVLQNLWPFDEARG